MARFQRSNLSLLRSQRRSVERRIGKLTYRIENDPMADLARLAGRRERYEATSAKLTVTIAAETDAEQRRIGRQACMDMHAATP